MPDLCDIADGTSLDLNVNNVPDECERVCPADVMPPPLGDNQVDLSDVNFILACWGTTNGWADINRDGIVDMLDLRTVFNSWGPCK